MQSPQLKMVRRIAMVIAGIVSLSAVTARADYRDDRRIMAEVDSRPLVGDCELVEVRTAAGSLTPDQIDQFATLANKGAADVARFVGVERPRRRIVIYLSPHVDISHTYTASSRHESRMFIDSRRVADHDAPYLHELVHAVVGDGGAMWLEEGFASWVASSVATTYGGYYAPVLSAPNDRVDAQARGVVERARGTDEPNTWFTADDPQLASQHERRNFYIVSHSFTKFLATSLGTKQLVTIFRADDPSALPRISGVSIDTWRQRWMTKLGEGAVAASGK
ncbi:MAG: hypothetical protein ACRD3J_16165 [Thermoanaerobaculia bacterium]